MTDLKVSVVIVSYNVRDLLDSCLQALLASRTQTQMAVAVVDNASSDGSAEMVRAKYPQVQWIQNTTNVGFAAANNQAIRMTDADFVLLLNPDAVVETDTVELLVRSLGDHPDLGIVGPRVLNPDGSLQAGPLRFPRLWSLTPGGLCARKPCPDSGLVPADWVLGACMMVRREVIEQVGHLDEGYFLYGEEKDWCMRAKKAGWKVAVLADARVIHYGGQSTSQRAPQSYQALIDSQVRFFTKHYPRPYRTAYLLNTLQNATAMELVARVMEVTSRDETWSSRAQTYQAGRRRELAHLLGKVDQPRVW